MRRQKMLFFIEGQLPTRYEQELIGGFSTKYDLQVRTKRFSDNFGDRDEPTDIVFNPPTGDYLGINIAQSAFEGVLTVGVGYKNLPVGATTRAHVCYVESAAMTVANEFTVNSQLDDAQDYTGSAVTVETSNAVLASSNTAVLTVATDGLVTGVSAGTATITATLYTKIATCDVTVR